MPFSNGIMNPKHLLPNPLYKHVGNKRHLLHETVFMTQPQKRMRIIFSFSAFKAKLDLAQGLSSLSMYGASKH